PVYLMDGKLMAIDNNGDGAAGCLLRSGVVPVGTNTMTFEWDGNLSYTYWGMCSQLELDFNEDEYLRIYIQTAEYNFGTEINRMYLRYYDGNQAVVIHEADIPIELTDFHFKDEIENDNLEFTSTILSSGAEYYNETINIHDLVPSYALNAINKVKYWVYTTTDNDNWLDNISIELNSSTDVYSNQIINSKINIFPNPVDKMMTVVLPDKETNSFMVTVSDLIGKILLHKQCIGSKTEIDISDLPKGLYIIKIDSQDGETIAIEKILKN
ncbi:MAG: T9SS type A sorting domain-containing protein, partial [Bacteroidales bacterium]|nr:T9SS type A sorting domain-containing protein [Bacteroidales bacterium]